MEDPQSQLAHKQAHFGHKYLNESNQCRAGSWGRLICPSKPMCMLNHLPTAQILILSRGKNLIPRMVNDPWLTNKYAHPPPFNQDFVYK